jgi:hypothetical protein
MDFLSDPPLREEETAREFPLPFTPMQLAKAAIAAGRDRAAVLYSAIRLIEGSAEGALDGETLTWLADKLAGEADEIMTDLDHAHTVLDGGAYPDSHNRFMKYLLRGGREEV